MARLRWTKPAVQDLDDVAEYIALDDPMAASRLVVKTFDKVERLKKFPNSGRRPPELPRTPYREVVVPPPVAYSTGWSVRPSTSSTSCVRNDCFDRTCLIKWTKA